MGAPGQRYEAISAKKLAEAKTKPASCSAVRWRIELRRRAMRQGESALADVGAQPTEGVVPKRTMGYKHGRQH